MVGYYSARKRGEVLIHGTAWMNLKNIMLCERSQTQKVTYIIPFICSVRNRQIRSMEKEKRGKELGMTENGCTGFL